MRIVRSIVPLSLACLCQSASAQSCDSWAYLDPAPATNARAVAYDPAQNAVIAFGIPPMSTTASSPAETFAIDDGVWTAIATGPDLRFDTALRSANSMAFDRARGVMVLNGGSTWEFVGGAWVQRATGFNAPLMTFDFTAGRVVAIGSDASLREWNGTAWTQRTTTGALPDSTPRLPFFHDPARNELWVCGSLTYSINANGAWTRRGAPWSAEGTPLAGYADAADQSVRVVTPTREYRFAQGQWQSVPLTGWPSDVVASSTPLWCAWNDERREVVVVHQPSQLATFNIVRTLALRSGVWVPYRSMGQIPMAAQSGLAYDAAADRMIASHVLGTVEIKGTSARLLDGRAIRPLAYDPSRGVVVGEMGSTIFTLAGNFWSARSGPAQLLTTGSATFDPARQRIVGITPGGVHSFDGDRWVLESAASVPESWGGSWIAFDPVRARSTLMVSSNFAFGPTRSEIDGALPTLINAPAVANYGVIGIYDPNRRGIVVAGGWHGADGSVFPRETSLLRSDATQWQQIAPTLARAIKHYGAAYDSRRERIVLWGGMGEGDSASLGPSLPVVLGFGPAAIVSQPTSAIVRAGQTVVLRVVAKGGGQVQYRWRKDGVELNDTVRRIGTKRDTLTIGAATVEDAGSYDVVVSNACGTETSSPVAAGPCPADFNTDGAVDGDDTIAFFGAWESGSADVDGDRDTDGDDVIAFFARWDAGC